jgi:hypothetical protein
MRSRCSRLVIGGGKWIAPPAQTELALIQPFSRRYCNQIAAARNYRPWARMGGGSSGVPVPEPVSRVKQPSSHGSRRFLQLVRSEKLAEPGQSSAAFQLLDSLQNISASCQVCCPSVLLPRRETDHIDIALVDAFQRKYDADQAGIFLLRSEE